MAHIDGAKSRVSLGGDLQSEKKKNRQQKKKKLPKATTTGISMQTTNRNTAIVTIENKENEER
jgi:hypothetical protein